MPQRILTVGGGSAESRSYATPDDYGYNPVAVEQNAERCEHLHSSNHPSVVHGDATRPEIIDQTDPERADMFAALTGSSETDHTLCRRLKTRVGTISTVARGGPSGDFTDVADGTVHSTVAGAKAVANAMPGYDEHVCHVPMSGFDLAEVGVDPRAPAANQELRTVAFPSGRHVVAGTEEMQVAGPGTKLCPDRQYLLTVEPTAADEVRNLLQGIR